MFFFFLLKILSSIPSFEIYIELIVKLKRACLLVHEIYVLSYVNSLQLMGMILLFSILSLEDIEFYDIFGNLVNLGKEEQIGLFDIFVFNYDIKVLLRHIGCMGNKN